MVPKGQGLKAAWQSRVVEALVETPAECQRLEAGRQYQVCKTRLENVPTKVRDCVQNLHFLGVE